MPLHGKTEDTFEHSTITCPTASSKASPPASLQEKNKANEPLGLPLGLPKQEKVYYSNLLADIIHKNIPGYQNFVKISPEFVTSSRNAYTTALRTQSSISGSH